ETAPQSHAPLFALSPDRARAERPRHFITDDDAADGRRSNRLHAICTEAFSQRAPERFRLRRMLQDERALQVTLAMQPARQHEMPFEQRARPLEPFDDLRCLHNKKWSVVGG